MASPKVIIFGPTGSVGSVVAHTAHSLGAKVYLAMRDPSKSIPNLPQAEFFERVQADLTNPDTVHAAVTSTGAKHAFIYCTFGTPDHMRATLEALKSGGIEFVQHAQVEIGLREVFGSDGGYAAVRPGYFASNLLGYKGAIAKEGGAVTIPCPEAVFDYITPEDIGTVSGTLLVEGKARLKGEGSEVFLAGPQLLSQAEVIGFIGKVLGRELKVQNYASDEEAVRFVVNNLGLPEPGAKQLVQGYRSVAEGKPVFDDSTYAEAVANVQKYGRRAPTKIHDWVKAHKAEFV
ncbi:hypothetical protein VTI74DRAFT_11064 [Chaetomium olivicolor]